MSDYSERIGVPPRRSRPADIPEYPIAPPLSPPDDPPGYMEMTTGWGSDIRFHWPRKSIRFKNPIPGPIPPPPPDDPIQRAIWRETWYSDTYITIPRLTWRRWAISWSGIGFMLMVMQLLGG